LKHFETCTFQKEREKEERRGGESESERDETDTLADGTVDRYPRFSSFNPFDAVLFFGVSLLSLKKIGFSSLAVSPQ
jgi:hypothetical protein